MRLPLTAIVVAAFTASILTRPGNAGSDAAPLERIVNEGLNGGPYLASPPIATWSDNAPFTGPIAILELLNTIAKAHGCAGWCIRHRCTDRDLVAIEVWVQAYEGYGGGGCRVTKRQW